MYFCIIMREIISELEDLKLMFNQRFDEIKSKYCSDKKAIFFTVSNTEDKPEFHFIVDFDCLNIV